MNRISSWVVEVRLASIFRGCIILGLVLSSGLARGQSLSFNNHVHLTNDSPEPQNAPMPHLSSGAQEAAREIGVVQLLEHLYRLPESQRCAGPSATLEAFMLRQEITEAVLATSLDVDRVSAEIDDEIAQITAIRNDLKSRRDRALKIDNIADIITNGGIGLIGSFLALRESTAKSGDLVSAFAGGASTLLSIIGIRKERGGETSFDARTNMLAKLFDRPLKRHSDFPEGVWSYLNTQPPSEQGKGARIAELKTEWIKADLIDNTPKGQRKIDLLTDSGNQPAKLSIDLLKDRITMLADLRSQIFLMKHDLSKLIQGIRCPSE